MMRNLKETKWIGEGAKSSGISKIPLLMVTGEFDAFTIEIKTDDFNKLAPVAITPASYSDAVKAIVCAGVTPDGFNYFVEEGKAVIPTAVKQLEAQGYEVIFNLAAADLEDVANGVVYEDEESDPFIAY